MNKIYKLKYDRRRNQLVAVSELTTGAGKEATGSVAGLSRLQSVSIFRSLPGTLTPLAVLMGLFIGMLPGLALANPDLPVGGQVVAGQGSISTGGNQMTIHQSTHGLVTNWNSFDIGQNHTVQFVQPDSSAVALNRVTGGHESQILGTLTANGQVMLVNPAGVMFGKGAKVNTAGLLASTKNIGTEDFMAGRYTFSGGSHPGAEIVNQGSLTTTKGGYIVLAADRVRNSGTIRTPSGKTVLAAADRVTLQLDNTGLASVSVNGSVVNALVENSGLIAATNGQVYLTARGKEMLLNTVVNNSGTVEARGLDQRGGEIVLDGGDSGVVSQSGMLLADSDTGRGGNITVQGANIHLAGGSRTSATGRTGGGEVYVGGGWQGKDVAIRNASKVVTDRDAVIDVSATEKGDGGKAVLWSENYTNFRGRILAKGGAQSGNGGQVETSSHNNLQAFGDVDASAAHGNAGEWLLDPTDITIVSTGTANIGIKETGKGTDGALDTDTVHVFSPNGTTTSQVLASKINNQLDNGTSVTIKTTGVASSGTQSGNITVNADISKTKGGDAGLTLEADGNISITNHNITSTTGKLNVSLCATGTNDGSITLNNASITTNGGDITLGQWVKNNDNSTSNLLNVSITNHSVLNAAVANNHEVPSNSNITLTANNGTVLSNVTLSGGNIILNVSKSNGLAFDVSCGTMSAATNLTLTGSITDTGNKALQVQDSELSAGDTISLTGEGNVSSSSYGGLNVANISFSADNTLLAGNVTGSGVAVRLQKNINVTKGNLMVTGKGNSGGGITGYSNLNLGVTGGNLTLNGCSSGAAAVSITQATLNAIAGNITIGGYGTNTNSRGGVEFSSVNLTAKDLINVTSQTGQAQWNSSTQQQQGGMLFSGNNKFTANNSIFNSTVNNVSGSDNIGAIGHKYGSPNIINITGNASITAKTQNNRGHGIVSLRDSFTFNVNNGNLSINTSGKDGMRTNTVSGTWADAGFKFNLNHANVILNATGTEGGIYQKAVSTDLSGLTFTGTGNVTVNATATTGNGIQVGKLDNSGLTGETTIIGTSKGNGSGILLTGNMNVNLVNATVCGSSAKGSGITVNAAGSLVQGAHLKISGGRLTGTSTSGTASGVNISGRNVNITGATEINGTSAGGAGVKLNASGAYNLNNVTITGKSDTGSGVDIGGSISSGNTAITGNSTSGNGVLLSGCITGDTTKKTEITGHSS
ncbi:TPA: beta strand repeat-containing protein, partial [Salmonella enterica]